MDADIYELEMESGKDWRLSEHYCFTQVVEGYVIIFFGILIYDFILKEYLFFDFLKLYI